MSNEMEFGRRDRLEIIADILKITRDGQSKTRILYGGNLSFLQLTEYLDFMIKKGLLEVKMDNKRRIYRTSNRGFKYLESYGEIFSLFTKKHDETRDSLQITK